MVSDHGNAAMTAMQIVPEQAGTENLQPLGVAALSTQLWLAPAGRKTEKPPTNISLSEQGLVQVLEAAVTGLEPGQPYLLALSTAPSATLPLAPLQASLTNPPPS